MSRKHIDLKEQFKKSSYKLTGQRQAIIDLLIDNSSEHLSAEDIYKILCQKNTGIGIATVYRTLSMLEKMKFITKINLDDGCVRYQVADLHSEHEHHHLICESCGNIQDIKDDQLEFLEKQVLAENGFHVYNHKVKLYGLCKNCYKGE